MEIILATVIIACLFALLSLTPMFRNEEPDECTDGEEKSACSTCGLAGGCSAAADRLPRR